LGRVGIAHHPALVFASWWALPALPSVVWLAKHLPKARDLHLSEHHEPVCADPRDPSPAHHELYLLACGLIAGILLGPAVFGRFAPSAYQSIFPSIAQARQRLIQLDASLAEARQRLTDIGVTDTAFIEVELRLLPQRQALQVELIRAQRSSSRLITLLAALGVAMVVEVVVASYRRTQRRRIVRTRYVLAAVVLALALAQPESLELLSLPFLMLLTLVIFVAAWAPGRAAT
jgi:hypothetical protein